MTCSVKTATIQVASRNNGILTYIPLNPDEVLKRMMDNGTSCECQFSANIPTTSKNVKKEKENRNIIEAKDWTSSYIRKGTFNFFAKEKEK